MISGILLAAGGSSRFGEEKLLQTVGGKRLVDWSMQAVVASAVDEVIVVCRPESIRWFAPPDSDPRLRWIVNPSADQGLARSIRCGLEACSRESEAALIAHADMPLIDAETINSIVARWKETPQKMVAPRAQGQQGNPVVIPRRYWSEVEALRGDVGCKSILQRHPESIDWIEFEDERVLFDVDSPADLLRWQARWKK